MKAHVHLKGLNGIRAIAVFCVIISHTLQSLVNFGLARQPGLQLADYGVSVFFTLSGFLITYLLLLEKEKFGDVDIRGFYVRRILRIWPLYYLFLALAILAMLVYEPGWIHGSLVFYIFLLANVPLINGTAIPLVGHYWSLGVEEQFYLVWPWIVKKVKRLLPWLLVFIVVMIMLKFVGWLFYHYRHEGLLMRAVQTTRFHCMAMGAAGAILYHRRDAKFLTIVYSPVLQVLIWTCFIVLALVPVDSMNINNEIVSALSVAWILNVSSNPKNLISLENWYLDYLGKISFGLYVFHPLVLFLMEKWLGTYFKGIDVDWRYIVIYVCVIFFTILIADLSYRFYESPFLKLKNRFAHIPSDSGIPATQVLVTQTNN